MMRKNAPFDSFTWENNQKPSKLLFWQLSDRYRKTSILVMIFYTEALVFQNCDSCHPTLAPIVSTIRASFGGGGPRSVWCVWWDAPAHCFWSWCSVETAEGTRNEFLIFSDRHWYWECFQSAIFNRSKRNDALRVIAWTASTNIIDGAYARLAPVSLVL